MSQHHATATTLRPPAEWRRFVGRPRTTWLRTIDDDLQSLNFGVHAAWRKARDRDVWHQVVSTATLNQGVHQYRKKDTPKKKCDKFYEIVWAKQCEVEALRFIKITSQTFIRCIN